jgi:predicted outer membrane protein
MGPPVNATVEEYLNQNLAKGLYVAGVTTFCTFLACWAVLAHQEGSHTTKPANSIDGEFARKAAQDGMAQVTLAQLAEEKAANTTVKRFAKRMVEENTRATDQLKDAALKANIPLPTNLDPKDQATYDALAKLSGADFDKAYAKEMVKDHQQDVTEFRDEANSGRKSAIKTFAMHNLPVRQQHLKMALQMEQTVSNTAVSRSRPNPSRSSAQRR